MSGFAPANAALSDAVYYDGLVARRRNVALRFSISLEILEEGAVIDRWPFETIRKADSASGELRLSSTSAPELARLVIADPALAMRVTAQSPRIREGAAGQYSSWRIVAWSLGAAISILLVTFLGIPMLADRIAPLVPRSIEQRMGDMVDGQIAKIFDAKECSGPEGTAAFAKMMAALQQRSDSPFPIRARVIRSSVANAIALPGGRVYLFRGLLDKAESPDEIAGVLAHELGHVQNRDAMRRLIQSGGTSFLLGLLFGDVTGAGAVIFATQQMLGASYSRDAESRADGAAIATMTRLGRSPVPAGELMQRITGDQKDEIGLLASHPLTGERLERFKREEKSANGAPILDFGEWRALKNICGAQG